MNEEGQQSNTVKRKSCRLWIVGLLRKYLSALEQHVKMLNALWL